MWARMTGVKNMPLDGNTDRELTRNAMRAEMLDAETELQLAYAWRDQRDEKALHRLITAYMRLAISMAGKFRRYGAPMNDLIQEASVGLMKAADKFDPDRGVRFSTYAVWWIKASIQDYVMRNWSMVRTGSTTNQKSLFFNLRRVQARLEREAAATGEPLDKHQFLERIASEVGVPLVHRHARGLILTEQGEILFKAAEEVTDKLEAAAGQLNRSLAASFARSPLRWRTALPLTNLGSYSQ